jgi:hypothetical protein
VTSPTVAGEWQDADPSGHQVGRTFGPFEGLKVSRYLTFLFVFRRSWLDLKSLFKIVLFVCSKKAPNIVKILFGVIPINVFQLSVIYKL